MDDSFKLSITGKRICLVCEQARVHCHRGHRRTAENTYVWKGLRFCRACRAEDAVWYRRIYKYKLSYEDVMEILEEQEFSCKSCGDVLDLDTWHAWCVDHDHSCCPGEYTCGTCVRGILCSSCNKGLGCFKDDLARLRAAVEYLEQYQLAARSR